MSSMTHPTTNHSSHHGTTPSYITGFILSLVFTVIPYYLVTRHVASGNGLLAIILGFAVLQMVVQVVFFLHLGREKKPHWQALFLTGTVGGILVVVVGSIWIMHHLHSNMTPVEVSKKLVNSEAIYQVGGEKTGACEQQYANHKVVIKDGKVSPTHIQARQCDTLTFINEDAVEREIAFGTHPAHTAYAGESELTVRKGRNETITLSQTGTYKFHDHLHPQLGGDFTVTPR